MTSGNGDRPEHVSGEVVTDEDLAPWERRAAESPPAWEAFECYLDLGSERSVRRVAREVGKDRSLIARWSSEHAWVARTIEWDREQFRQRAKAQNDAVQKMAERQATVAEAMHEAASLGVRAILRRIKLMQREADRRFPSDPEAAADFAATLFPLSFDEVIRLADLGQKLERQARGEPDVRTEVSGVADTLDPVARAIVTDPGVREASRELVRAAAQARAGIPGRAGAGDK